MGRRRGAGSKAVATAVATGFAVLVGTLAGTAAGKTQPDLTMKVQLVPDKVAAGQETMALVTFQNTSSQPLTGVHVTVQFPPALAATGAGLSAAGCTPLNGSLVAVSCPLGDVKPGDTLRRFVGARVNENVRPSSALRVSFFLRIGPGNPSPITSFAAATVGSANNAASKVSCKAVPTSLSATHDGQTTSLPAPPKVDPSLGLPCTPIGVGVGVFPTPANAGFNTQIASAFLPKLTGLATVKLQFADEKLPDESPLYGLPSCVSSAENCNPNPLWEVNPADPTASRRVVPKCGGKAPGWRLPAGPNSCVETVVANDTDGDHDAGTLTLLVRGSTFDDPHWMA